MDLHAWRCVTIDRDFGFVSRQVSTSLSTPMFYTTTFPSSRTTMQQKGSTAINTCIGYPLSKGSDRSWDMELHRELLEEHKGVQLG
jgi:hypothetical protein